jgi:hypothetical protein
MKKASRLLLVLAIGCIAVSITGCNKVFDYFKNDNDQHNTKYKVKKITGQDLRDTGMFTFTYNKWGDPVSIVSSYPTTGSWHSFFKYDKQHRLTDYYTAYDDIIFDQWHKYYYDKKGNIIRDTTYLLGRIGEHGPETAEQTRLVHHFEYDIYGRISKTIREVLNSSHYVDSTTYTYNSQGNLVRPGITYDNKLNIYQTHKLWMFIARDYSVNNPFIADAYNNAHLPVKLSRDGEFERYPFLGSHLPANKVEIEYTDK